MKNIIEIRNTADGLKQESENYSIKLDIFLNTFQPLYVFWLGSLIHLHLK